MFIKIENDAPVGDQIDQPALLRLFPNTSFVLPITPDNLAPFGYGVIQGTQPTPPGRYQVCVEGVPQKNPATGYWDQTWNLVDMTPEQRAATDAAQGNLVRSQRDQKLADSDWTQLPDSPADKPSWATYRQALREVTSQPGFPWAIAWPVPPQQ